MQQLCFYLQKNQFYKTSNGRTRLGKNSWQSALLVGLTTVLGKPLNNVHRYSNSKANL